MCEGLVATLRRSGMIRCGGVSSLERQRIVCPSPFDPRSTGPVSSKQHSKAGEAEMSDFLLESLGKSHERGEEVLATPTRNRAPTVWRSDGVHARLGSGAVIYTLF